MEITGKEKDAIRFYQGDVRKRDAEGNLIENSKQSGLYGIKGAYCIMPSK